MLRRKWLTRARIVLFLLSLININSTNAELYRTGCLLNSNLCDKNEFCQNDKFEGICLPNEQLGDEDDTNESDKILENLAINDQNGDDELNENLNIGDNGLKEFNNDNSDLDNPENQDLVDNGNDELRRCLINLDTKYKNYQNELKSDVYFRLLKALCDDYISNENEPRIPIKDNEQLDLGGRLISILEQEKNKDELLRQLNRNRATDDDSYLADTPVNINKYPTGNFVVVTDNDRSPNNNLNDKMKEIDDNLNEAELLTRDTGLHANQNIDKKLDQKKPGPQFANTGFRLDDFENDKFDDNKYEDKRFDESRILSETALNDDSSQFENSNTDVFKRKFAFSTPPPDHKPVEEGAVHVELDPQKNIQLIEPTSSDESASPFVAVDSSYAYIYFLKYPKKRSTNTTGNQPQIYNEKQLMERDDILARKYFVNNLQKRMLLPTGVFSDIKLESSESNRLSDCLSFPLLEYLIVFENTEQKCNCKLLIASFKVNPNTQQLNASLVADQIEQYKESLQKETGLFVIQTGIGDKVKIERKRNCNIDLLHSFINLSLFAVAAILVISLVIFYQRKECLRQKIYSAAWGAPALVGWFTEKDYTQSNLASKPQKLSKADMEKQALDYQDLCRQRIKANEQKKCKEKSGSDEMRAVYQVSNNTPTTIDKNKTQQKSQSTVTNSPAINDQLISTAMNMEISTGHLILEYMENHLKQNGDKLNREWSALCSLNTDDYLQSTQNAAKLTPNKNRYPNDSTTWPFDNSRVILNDLESKDQIDYINASTIIDSDPNPVYIATQGPMKDTISDFWQMVWQQGSSVIVMLTRLVENGVEQSAKYWPEKGSETYLHFEVNLVSEHIWSEQYLVRSLYLKNLLKNETRTVTQFHFMSWPENAVPTTPASLLEFRRKVNKSYREKSSPIIVHCSDGCNRTGAYILIDIVLNRLTKGVKEIDLTASLECLRDQRPAMVRNKETYEFCLRSIAEEVHNLLRSLQK